jgi:predicted glycosyltransferase
VVLFGIGIQKRGIKMRILVDIGHPAHVHLFKNAIWKLKENGHEIKITARNKEITTNLLEAYDLDYVNLGDHKKTMVGKAFGILQRDYALYKVAKKFKPEVLVGGVGNLYLAQVSRLLGKPSIIFDDTEHAYLEHLLCHPFATVICTPSCFKKDLGPKQIRYNGYHELAYLHPNYFTPDPSVLGELELKEGERFIIMRFVAWDASHDVGQKGISMEMRRRLVSEIEKYGRVLITSESELAAEFEPYRIKVAPERIHDLLYYAALYVGEGGTMATEAAVLGTPSVYISSLVGLMGNFEELETKYDLMQAFIEPDDALKAIHNILSEENSKSMWQKRREILLSEKIDVTKFMVEFIEKY